MLNERLHTLWEASSRRLSFQPLQQDISVDVAIVGGGITGLTAAVQLKRLGHTVAVLESQRIAAGTSGSTSAHLTTTYDHSYQMLERAYGVEAARLMRQALTEAIDLVDSLVQEYGIDCDFRRVPGYLYTENSNDIGRIEAEILAGQRADLAIEATSQIPLPFATKFGCKISNQARFHPIQYLNGLAAAIDGEGCRLYDQTRIVDFDDGRPCQLRTDAGHKVSAGAIILATHIPLGVSAIQAALQPYRSFVIAVRVAQLVPDALFWDTAEPYNYIRVAPPQTLTPNETVILIGGKDIKTGHGDEHQALERLESWARERFEIIAIDHRWSAQFYDPVDHLPSIGRLPLGNHIYVGTGYSGDGLTLGTMAGHMLAEQIMDHETAYDELFRPTRLHFEGIKGFIKDSAHIAKMFVSDRLRNSDKAEVAALSYGEGCVVRSEGKQIAAFRDNDGDIRLFSAVCPHMRCIVHWNHEQGTFDCPCHGSRFDSQGKVLEGPALQGLQPVKADTDLLCLIKARRESETWRAYTRSESPAPPPP